MMNATNEYDDLAASVRAPLLAFGLKLSGDPNTAEDLTQQTLLIAHRKFLKFDRKRGSFKSWCNSILLNQWRDYIRSAKRREVNLTSLSADGRVDEIADPAVLSDMTVDVEAEAISSVTLSEMLDKLAPGTETRIAVRLSNGEDDDSIREALTLSMDNYEAILQTMRVKLAEYNPYRVPADVSRPYTMTA